jgi:hypothetical protein
MVAHACKHTTDASSLAGLVQAIWLISDTAASEKVRAEAIDLVTENFAKTEAIRPHLMQLASGLDTAGADLVRSVFKDHPDPRTRAQAAKALIAGQSQRERTAPRIRSISRNRLSPKRGIAVRPSGSFVIFALSFSTRRNTSVSMCSAWSPFMLSYSLPRSCPWVSPPPRAKEGNRYHPSHVRDTRSIITISVREFHDGR